jgi:hypothetical protein
VRFEDDCLRFVMPKAGDWVSLHWDFVCDRLTEVQASALLRANERALAAVNRSRGPASVLS